MDPATLFGLGTALATPFYTDGSVDHDSLRALVLTQIDADVDFLVPCGSTGEAATLTEDETDAVISTVVKVSAGRLPIVAGCTHNSTAEAVRRAQRIAGLPGVDCILTANPYYSKPNQLGQYLHFKAIADAIDLPVLLYNIPGRTAANLEPETLLRLAELPNVIGVKESSGNMDQIGRILAGAPASFSLFAGDDHLALPIIAGGGKGLISVASNAAPGHIAQMVHAALAQQTAVADEGGAALQELFKTLFVEPNPAPVKALLAMLGVIAGDTLRLPMVPVADATRERLRSNAAALKLL